MEGFDGTGKSTQSKLLKNGLDKENIDSILLCLSAVRQVISNGLNVLGITPMQKM